jgi:phosphoribosylformylglycinamidine synthase
MKEVVHIFRIDESLGEKVMKKIGKRLNLQHCQAELCFNIEVLTGSLLGDEMKKLEWLLNGLCDSMCSSSSTTLVGGGTSVIVEVGPRLAFTTAWSSNCTSMCHACGIHGIGRIEMSRRLEIDSSVELNSDQVELFIQSVHDKMTECVYPSPLISFTNDINPEIVTTLPISTRGQAALEEVNESQGLGFDSWDLQYYTDMFATTLKRDPTSVEIFDLSQSNSEHSRHWFFGGRMVIDGEEQRESLFDLVKSTLIKGEGSNSVIAFHDNSSVHFKHLLLSLP